MPSATLRLLLAGLLIGTLVAVAGCDTAEPPTLFDPDRPSTPDPVLTSITPEGAALAGVDLLTITGQNFSSVLEENLVYFGATPGEVIDASPAQLTVRPPATPGEVMVRVVVLGAENFSNEIAYRLDAAFVRVGDLLPSEEPFGIATDGVGNLLASMFAEGVSAGIDQFTPEGVRSDYFDTSFKFDDLVIGPDGLLYGVRGVRAIFQLPEGGAQATWAVLPNTSTVLTAITFDGQGNLWGGGDNAELYRVAPDLSVTAYPFDALVRDLIVYDGFLYAAATQGEETPESKVWRFPLNGSGDLGAAEVYFDVTQEVGALARALAFTATGDLFIGVDREVDPVIHVTPDRMGAPLYPGILTGPARAFEWDATTGLYMVRARVAIDNENFLPGDLIRIETRQMGAG